MVIAQLDFEARRLFRQCVSRPFSARQDEALGPTRPQQGVVPVDGNTPERQLQPHIAGWRRTETCEDVLDEHRAPWFDLPNDFGAIEPLQLLGGRCGQPTRERNIPPGQAHEGECSYRLHHRGYGLDLGRCHG
jgi:hypothetical protein